MQSKFLKKLNLNIKQYVCGHRNKKTICKFFPVGATIGWSRKIEIHYLTKEKCLFCNKKFRHYYYIFKNPTNRDESGFPLNKFGKPYKISRQND